MSVKNRNISRRSSTSHLKLFDATVCAHHGVVQHTQSVLMDRQPNLVLLDRRGGDGLGTGDTTRTYRSGALKPGRRWSLGSRHYKL